MESTRTIEVGIVYIQHQEHYLQNTSKLLQLVLNGLRLVYKRPKTGQYITPVQHLQFAAFL